MTRHETNTRKRVNVREFAGYTCDRCRKFYDADDLFEIQEFLNISFTGGFKSVFGDMARVECDLCQYCVKDLIQSFARVESYD